MSTIARAGAYAYQKRQVAALEDAETLAQMGLDAEDWTARTADRAENEDADEVPLGAAGSHQGDERVLAAARAL